MLNTSKLVWTGPGCMCQKRNYRDFLRFVLLFARSQMRFCRCSAKIISSVSELSVALKQDFFHDPLGRFYLRIHSSELLHVYSIPIPCAQRLFFFAKVPCWVWLTSVPLDKTLTAYSFKEVRGIADPNLQQKSLNKLLNFGRTFGLRASDSMCLFYCPSVAGNFWKHGKKGARRVWLGILWPFSAVVISENI